MTTRQLISAATVACACALMADGVPEAGNVSMTQDPFSREVTITYTLANAPAVVTLDIQTNGPNGWVSIGGEHIDCFSQDSDVWKKVSGKETYTIKWNPDLSWPSNKVTLADGGVKAVLTAWALDDTPDYMVADITSAAEPNSQRYYPSVDFLPGGLFGKDDYRTTKLVMRKIHAKNVRWTMGSVLEPSRTASEATHDVTLTNNYYIGVFEVTQTQFQQIAGFNNSSFKIEGAMRSANMVSFNALRCATVNSATYAGSGLPTDAPYAGSFLDILNRRTGLDFDLPGEAQWEYACRAGHGEGRWGDGSYISDATDAGIPGRCQYTGGKIWNGSEYVLPSGSTTGPTNGTAIVGSYVPNSWGLYDMHGNQYEYCLDWYEADISSLNGAINIDPENPLNTRAGQVAGAKRVRRGGAYHTVATACRPAARIDFDPKSADSTWGFRLVCRAGLK